MLNLIMAALLSRCGWTLYFCPVVSSSIFLFFSPNLSRLDVYHISAHGVILVRI